jgi:hypothetical protein
MRHFRYLPASLIFAGLLFLAGAIPWRAAPLVRPPADVVPDPAAAGYLAQALKALDPERLPALETTIWQQVHLPGLEYVGEGRYLLGPGHRYRLELKTTVQAHTGTLLQVCDGNGLWQGTRTSPGRWTEIRHARMDQVLDSLSLPVASAHTASANMRQLVFCGVQPLLRNLEQRLVWTRHETIQKDGAECVVLTGAWQPGLLQALAPPEVPWPAGLPSQCRLWLDSRTAWPHRLEWRGPDCSGEASVLLVEMELRAPVFNPELTPERCAAEFHFDPGQTPVLEVGDPPPLDLVVQSGKGAPASLPR